MPKDNKKGDTNALKQLPTVAVSDAFNVAGHLLGAQVVWERDDKAAALGFLLIAVAATVGVLRFGFSERLFAKANGDLADLAVSPEPACQRRHPVSLLPSSAGLSWISACWS